MLTPFLLPRSAPLLLTDYSQVDVLGPRFESVTFGATPPPRRTELVSPERLASLIFARLSSIVQKSHRLVLCGLVLAANGSHPPSGEYRGTSILRNSTPLGPYSRPMPRALWWSYGGSGFLCEVPL